MKQRRIYAYDEWDFEDGNRDTILKYNDHQINCDESESEEDETPSPEYQCDLCDYISGWPDNVAFHYKEEHKIQMNWKENESRLRK